jgi:hypothetical protein
MSLRIATLDAKRSDMNPRAAFSPVSLSYAAALRGVKARRPGEAFAYAEAGCRDLESLTCLAASNPEGRFFGFMTDPARRAEAEARATARGVTNVAFFAGALPDILTQVSRGVLVMPPLNYLCCDDSATGVTSAARADLFSLAEKLLMPGGLFCLNYRAYDREDGALRFMVSEFAPEMNAAQAMVFLSELKQLGSAYFTAHPQEAARLDAAIARRIPDEFFSTYEGGQPRSGSFETTIALGPKGFVYAGDASIASNYIELSVPAEAQPLIMQFRGHMLYEQIKDFALNRTMRCDIWARYPVQMSADPAELFGGFSYGITLAPEEIPSQIQAKSKTIDLTSPLYRTLIELMTLMPVSIGDILTHPQSHTFTAEQIIEALQIMVACGVAHPMRGLGHPNNVDNVVKPRLVGSYNRQLDRTELKDEEVLMASVILGSGVTVSVREALVMQALDRAGLADSVSALFPELQRLAQNPATSARVLNSKTPTPEAAQAMVQEIVNRSIVQWYAYGLLEAA